MTVTCNRCGIAVFLMGQWDEEIEESYVCMRCVESMMHETTATIASILAETKFTNEFNDLDILIRLNELSGTFHTRQIKNGKLLALEVW